MTLSESLDIRIRDDDIETDGDDDVLVTWN